MFSLGAFKHGAEYFGALADATNTFLDVRGGRDGASVSNNRNGLAHMGTLRGPQQFHGVTDPVVVVYSFFFPDRLTISLATSLEYL